jgi:Recombinase
LLKADLDALGVVSKARTASDGSRYGQKPLARGALYLMLQNRTYRGETVHKDKSYLGEHEALVDEALWNEVQALLASYRLDRVPGTTDRQPSLLAGILFDAQGERMTPTHAIKRGTRYRYYVSRSLLAGKTKDLGQRIPAPALETLVTEPIRDWLADPAGVFARFRSPRSRTDSSLAVHRQLRYATKHRKSRSNSHCRNAKNTLNISVLSRGGEGGIRTHGTVTRTTVFEF